MGLHNDVIRMRLRCCSQSVLVGRQRSRNEVIVTGLPDPSDCPIASADYLFCYILIYELMVLEFAF